MFMEARSCKGLILVAVAFLGGCASLRQPVDKARIREAGMREYGPPVDLAGTAQELWEFAALSENVYTDPHQSSPAEPFEKACAAKTRTRLPLSGWTRWPSFPSPSVAKKAKRNGLYVEVWQKDTVPATVAVVFEGTNFWSLPDWGANLRWFLRFIPLFPDQYTIVAKKVGKEFVEQLAMKGLGPDVTIVAAGHSLGGGLAQHFAYSFPIGNVDSPRVSYVYAFNPSPVTGWTSVPRAQRTANVKGLKIDRVFEHGEVLAFPRVLVNFFNPPDAKDPEMRHIRYNFMVPTKLVKNHGMRLLACELANASGKATLPDLGDRFEVSRRPEASPEP